MGEQDGSGEEWEEESRDQDGLLFCGSSISGLKAAGYMT
jgi:hypothetical protein